jgi:hypothetical protein
MMNDYQKARIKVETIPGVSQKPYVKKLKRTRSDRVSKDALCLSMPESYQLKRKGKAVESWRHQPSQGLKDSSRPGEKN